VCGVGCQLPLNLTPASGQYSRQCAKTASTFLLSILAYFLAYYRIDVDFTLK